MSKYNKLFFTRTGFGLKKEYWPELVNKIIRLGKAEREEKEVEEKKRICRDCQMYQENHTHFLHKKHDKVTDLVSDLVLAASYVADSEKTDDERLNNLLRIVLEVVQIQKSLEKEIERSDAWRTERWREA